MSSVTVADSALFALTQLERDPPDLIVSAGDVGMSGAEFLEILRDDVLLKEIAVILLDETALTQITPGAREIVLERWSPPAVVLGAATSLLARTAAEAAPHLSPNAPSRDLYLHSSYLHGTAKLISPFDLLTLLAREKNTGHLTFDLGNRAALHFDKWQLVHAEYGQLTGEPALLETLRAVQLGEGVRFDYRPAAPEDDAPVTLVGPLDTLLFRAALELDRSLQQ